MSKLRIFLADDHPIVRDGLRGLIEAQSDMKVIGEATDGERAVREVLKTRPDVVVMDVSMPGLGGVEATAQIMKACPSVRVVALTANEDRGYLKPLLAAGAVGYVLKRSAADDLIQALRIAAAGKLYLDPAVAPQVVAELTGAPLGSGTELSEREAEVLRLVAQGYLIKQIATQLKVEARTVETYKSRAMEKLGLKTRVDVVRYASQQGWLSAQ